MRAGRDDEEDRWSFDSAASHLGDDEEAGATAAGAGDVERGAGAAAVPARPRPRAMARAAPPPPPPKLRFAREGRAGMRVEVGGVISADLPVRQARVRSRRAFCGSLWSYLAACWAWCAYETHAMLFHWCCPAGFGQLPMEEQLRHPLVARNPLYWLLFLMTVPFLLVGMVFHDAIGQGPAHFEATPRHARGAGRSAGAGGGSAPGTPLGSSGSGFPSGGGGVPGGVRAARAGCGAAPAPVCERPSEVRLLAEKHIRVHWLYMTDAFYFLELLLGLALLLNEAAHTRGGWSHALTNVRAAPSPSSFFVHCG